MTEGQKKVLFSNITDHWRTPTSLYNHFINDLKCIDPCPFQADFDGLDKIYKDKLFINPPYSQISKWVDFIEKNLNSAKEIYFLIPARTDTKYFHRLVNIENCVIDLYFIKGRLHFNDAGAAPFPSVLFKLRRVPIPVIDLQCHFIEYKELFKID